MLPPPIGVTVNATAFEVLLDAFCTVTLKLPGVNTKPAGTVIVSCVALTNVVATLVPFHSTVDVFRNPLPLTCNKNGAAPAVIEFGFNPEMFGAALPIANCTEAVSCPPGFCTERPAEPALAISEAGTPTVNWV